MNNKQRGFIFYIFWITLLCLGSVILIIFLHMIVPQALLDSLKGDRVALSDSREEDVEHLETNRFNQDTGTVMHSSDNIDIPTSQKNPSSLDSSSTKMKNIEDMDVISPLAMVFSELEVQEKGTFTDNTGSTYLVGTLALSGIYPSDFNIPVSNGIQVPVTVTITIGWKHLPKFREIEELYNSEQEYRILVPPLEILSVQIPRIKSLNNKTNQLMSNNIKENLSTMFERGRIPEQIILHAQQQLASDYVLKGYKNITLIPFL